jgi:TusA-related sulfurtransferase/predicted nucleic acid-binding protein
MKQLIFILLAFISLASYGQTKQTIKQLTVNDSLTIKAGNPAANKIAVSIDGNGRFRWVYFSDFQDSINTGVYDSLLINYLNANSVRVNRDSFTDPAATIASIGDSGFVVECFTCDTIQYILDNLAGGGYSPWDTTATAIVQKDTTLNVVIGTNYPIYPSKLFAEGEVVFVDTFGDIISTLIASAKLGFINLEIKNTVTNITNKLEIAGSNASLSSTNTALSTQSGISFQDSVITLTNGTQADGYVLTSDASGNATWQDHTAYGEMGFGDSTRTIALTQNVFSVVTNSNNTLWSTAAIDLHNVTYSGDSLIIDSAGTYQVNVQLSMDGTSGSVIRLGVFLNGVLACSCTGYQELLNNRILQLTYINIDALNAGDVLQVVITNTANNDDVDAIGGKLMVNKIR